MYVLKTNYFKTYSDCNVIERHTILIYTHLYNKIKNY